MLMILTYLRILVSRQILVTSSQLCSNFISLLLSSILNDSLYDSTGIMLQHNILHFASYDVHKVLNVFVALRCWDVLLSSKGPY